MWVAMVITALMIAHEPGTVQPPSSLIPHDSPAKGPHAAHSQDEEATT